MALKAIALVLIVGLSVVLFLGFHKESRADAAGGNCYASAQGPASPTLCQ